MKTFSDRVREENIQQGMQQGMKQGEALSLLRLMRQRIESAEPVTLSQWFEQALAADRLDEVLH